MFAPTQPPREILQQEREFGEALLELELERAVADEGWVAPLDPLDGTTVQAERWL